MESQVTIKLPDDQGKLQAELPDDRMTKNAKNAGPRLITAESPASIAVFCFTVF